MPKAKHVSSSAELEIEHDLAYQKRKWIIERVSWMFMALVILAALLGLLGSGPLSRARVANSTGSLQIDYDRFLHLERDTTLQVQITAEAVHQDTVRVWLNQDYLLSVRIDKMMPQPERVEIGNGRCTFVFRVAGKNEPLLLLFHVQPIGAGLQQVQVGLEEEEPTEFAQFVYP